MNTVIVENCKTLFIGRRGENEVTEVVFDFTEWQAEFGNGVIDLFVKRNGDSAAYPVVLSVDGTVATWLVTATDTNVADYGKAEYVYTVDGKIAKSAVFTFYVAEDIGQASGEAPDPYEDWIETLTGLGTETQLNAHAAEQSANDAAESAASAATSADQSEDSAEDAEAWAVGERNGEPVTEGDPTYNNNAKFWAGKAMTDAPVTSVNGKAGDIVLNLDDIPNGEQYARTTPAQVQQIGTNAADIADIEELIPTEASANNKLVDKNYVDSGDQTNTDAIAAINSKIPPQASASNQLADKILVDTKLMAYRKAADQDAIDSAQDGKINALTNLLNKKQTKITANGILKGNGNGGVSAAVAGMDYLPTSALYAYRSANAQDAIDNAQNDNINKNTAALNTMQPAATAADIGKALIVKTVADGKPTSYEYGEAGGGSTLTAGDGIDLTNDVISNTQGIEYIVGTQTAATSKWTGVSTDETLKAGKIIAYYLPFAGTSTAATLALTMADGTTTREISLQLKPNATVTTQFPAGSIIILVYDGSYWRVNASYDTDTNTYPTGYCVTNGSVAAKAAACSFGYRGDTNYFPCLFRYANTATDATLAITTYAPEAAPIYVNGARTSASNTFGAGVILFLYYNGAYYCYNDGRFPILVDGAVTSVQEYATGLLVNYRTAAAQDTIDSGKQAKITATGILKGDGAGGVSAAVEGTDYIKGLEILSYGNSTWDDFLTAYTAKKVVYCRASSNTNPASGDQTRLAFMAYVNNADNPTNVEFQYYRSIQTHSDSQQGDQVFVYKLDKTAGWTVTTRNTFTAVDVGTGLSKAYSNGKLTLGVNSDYRTAADQDTIDSEQDERLDAVEQTTTATTIGPVAIATFDASTANMPLKGLTVDIEPVQDLHGYDYPWPAGGGKNLLKYPYYNTTLTSNGITFTVNDDGSVTVNGTATANADLYFFNSTASLPLSNGSYIFSSSYTGQLPSSGFYIHAKANAEDAEYLNVGIGEEGPYTVSNGVFYTACIRVANGRTINNVRVYPMIRLATEADATFEPYSNICPITGWTGCNIVATKNIFDIDNATWVNGYLIAADGTITANSRYKYCSNYTPIIGGSKITVSGTRTSVAAAFGTPISFYDDQKTFLSRISTFPADGVGGYVQVTVDVPEDAAFFRLNCYDVTTPVSDFQIEYGDTATDFSPFSSFDVTFPSEAGTVYGGTLDVMSGKLSVEYASLTLPNADSIRDSALEGTGKWVRYYLPRNTSVDDDTVNAIGEKLKGVNRSSTEYRAAWTIQTYSAGSNRYLAVFVPADYTLEQIDTAIADSQIVYKLTTPIVYDLTDIPEITTLFGENNIWADCGDVTVTYGAYLEAVKSYADKVGDSILSAIAPLETSYIATRGYAVGTYLFVGTKFFKVTSAIAEGGTITPGTNVVQTTVAMQLIAQSRDIATLFEMYDELIRNS